jgi:hypothetical protein
MYYFEATLMLGELEVKSGKTAAGRFRLQALRKDAGSKDHQLIAN